MRAPTGVDDRRRLIGAHPPYASVDARRCGCTPANDGRTRREQSAHRCLLRLVFMSSRFGQSTVPPPRSAHFLAIASGIPCSIASCVFRDGRRLLAHGRGRSDESVLVGVEADRDESTRTPVAQTGATLLQATSDTKSHPLRCTHLAHPPHRVPLRRRVPESQSRHRAMPQDRPHRILAHHVTHDQPTHTHRHGQL
jgi:hypothetical protein